MLNDGVIENVLLLSSVELEDDIEEVIVVDEVSDLDTIFFSSLVEHVCDDEVKENVELDDDIEDDIVDKEAPGLDTEFCCSLSSFAWVELVTASLVRLSTVVGT